MTKEEAACILDPEAGFDKMAKLEYRYGFSAPDVLPGMIKEARKMGAEALRKDGTDTDVPTKDAHIGSPCQACGYGGRHLDAPPCTSCPAHPKSPAHIDREAWVSVEERLPEDEKEVLAYYGFDRGDGDLGMRFMGALAYFSHDPMPHWQHESTGLTVTHWMPLPEPPDKLEKRMGA